jgi:nucleoside-diphosphate-sugar epimerase
MNILVTGGAGFIGRWVVKYLLDDGHYVWTLDDLSNGRANNISEFKKIPNFKGLTKGDINDKKAIKKLFKNKLDICYHLAAKINVQDSIDDPQTTFNNDVVGTFNVLEHCRMYDTKIVFMSTCMVYEQSKDDAGIDENHPTKPASPYAGSKIAGENMVLSYWFAYELPVVVLRPFNVYGPFQKTTGEGGVVAIFIKRKLNGQKLDVYGDGMQTRDLMYVEDCANFVVDAGYSDKVNGEVINAGTGKDISINDLATLIVKDKTKIEHVKHIHPQSEIQRLLCNCSKAKKLLGWVPKTPLEKGIGLTETWIRNNPNLT